MKYTCSSCQLRGCRTGDTDKMPKNCPTKNEEAKLQEITKLYEEEEDYKIAKASAEITMAGYGISTRVKEIIDFCHAMNYKKIGLAFCTGLSKEAQVFTRIMMKHGFEIEALICKLGSVDKEVIGVCNSTSPMCNPIAQAEFLNKEKTDFNIVLGLCVGHDTLFFKHSEAPVTVLAVKDRVLAHNPLGAIYLADSFYKDKL